MKLLIFLSAVGLLACAVPMDTLHADGSKLAAAPVRCVLKLDPEIDCPSCEDRLKQIVQTSRGVQSAEVDVLTNRITVRYDPARISVRALIGRIAVTGYTATEVK